MISVVIPLYNKVSTVERAILSVLTQTVQDFELIVVNNGSTDGSEKVVENINDVRIKLVHQNNQGVSMARNRGIEEASSEWVAFLDADDEWRPTFLETVVQLQEMFPDCDVYATAYQRCDNSGNFKNIKLQGLSAEAQEAGQKKDSFLLENYFEVASQSDPPFCSISVMVRKEALMAIGGFPKGIHQGEDLLTWARLAANGRIAYSLKPQSIFHTGVTSSMGIPKRIPAADDPVGKGLEEIYNQHPETQGLKQYIAHWHKMRASIYLRLPKCSRQCRNEIRAARHWHRNKRLIYYQILSYIPYRFRMNIINHI